VSFDPSSRGALCARCPLQGSIVVPPEHARRSSPFVVLVGEAPGEKEEENGRPFVGPSGFELMRAMQAVGLRRADCHVTNALLCRPPGNKVDKAEKDASARNKRDETDKWLSPVDACRPRLLREIGEVAGNPANVIALGGIAYRALTARREKPMEVRGGPREEAFGHLLPTLHPAFVMRTRRWTGAFIADLARAKRWFTTGLAWKDPDTSYRPTPTDLRTWLAREVGTPFVVYDVETAPGFPDAGRYDAMHDPLRVVGLSSHDGRRAIVVPFRSVEDPTRLFYTMAEYVELVAILRDFFAS
jgi:uracil-DNA glycosylase family 4